MTISSALTSLAGQRRGRNTGTGSMWRKAIAQRLSLLRASAPEGVQTPRPSLLLGEVRTFCADRLRWRHKPVGLPKAQNRQVVMLLPGFCTHPLWMRHMARQLEAAGHRVTDWGLGFNLGPTPENFDLLARHVCALSDQYGQRVMLVGWSLGGIFAREVAKRRPEHVARVITMGSPFSGSPYGNNAWRLYHLVTGHSVDRPPMEVELPAKPPVETVALWSPRDGIVSRRCARGWPGERDKAVMLHCTHIGFAASSEAIRAVAAELDRPAS